ncbi:hypothetical protein CL656_03470 [bacterium]|nr:hypothetical protein [bacterium]|tara:strand:- start:5729 stop:6178 length:450 start_codon:yes stop_codon:yes gene_type:complete
MSDIYTVLNFKNRESDRNLVEEADLSPQELLELEANIVFLSNQIVDLFENAMLLKGKTPDAYQVDLSLNLSSLDFTRLFGVHCADQFFPGFLTVAAQNGLKVALDNFDNVRDLRVLEFIKGLLSVKSESFVFYDDVEIKVHSGFHCELN